MVPLNNLEIAKANVERAEAACDARRYEIARQCAVDAITADPNSGDGYASLGRACLGLQEFEEAEKHFREAYSIDPTDAWYLIGLAISLRCQKNASESLKVADELVRLHPLNSRSHEVRGKALNALKRFADAKVAFEEAIKLDPENIMAIFGTGYSLIELKKPKEAEACFRRVLRLDSNNAHALNNLGVSLENQGNLRDAALAYKSAVLLDPTWKTAKKNTTSAVERYLAAGSGISALLFYFAFKVAFQAGQGKDSISQSAETIFGVLVVTFVLAAIGIVVYQRSVRGKRRRELESKDPQLLEIYNTIKRNDED